MRIVNYSKNKIISLISFFIILLFTFSLFCQETLIDSLEAVLATKAAPEKLAILIQLADVTLKSDSEKCSQYCNQAMALIEQGNADKAQQAEIHKILSILKYDECDYPSSIENSEKAIFLYSEIHDNKELADAHQRLGNVYRVTGQYDDALYNLNIALELHTKVNDNQGVCADNYYLGAAYLFKNDYERTLKHNLIALDLIGSYPEPNLILECGILNLIGRSYEFQKDYEKALDYFKQVLGLLEGNDIKETKAQTLHNIAMLYDKMGKQKEALPYLEEALEIVQQTKNIIGVAYTYQNLGIVYYNDGQFTKAAVYFELSLPLFSELGIQFGLSTVHLYLAKIYFEQNDLTAAETNIKKSLDIAEKIRMKGLIKEGFSVLSEIQFKYHDYKNAYLNLKKSTAYIDSVYTEEKNKSITEMQTKYETEKKEQENQFLKEKNEYNDIIISKQKSLRNLLIIILLIVLISLIIIYNNWRQRIKAYQKLEEADKIITQQNDELEIMNKTRDRFFSIISHDLKNSFSSITLGAKLLSDTEKFTSAEIKMIGAELLDSVENLSKMLENLLEWARIQIGRAHHDPICFNISRIVQDVLSVYREKAAQKNIEIKSDLEVDLEVLADKNMIFSVLQNLISNAIKFTEKDGRIEISGKAEDEMICVEVSDNGVGIPAAKIDQLFKVDAIFSTPGTADEKGTGLGLILCREFVEKNDGKIVIESEENCGTKVTITLPKG